MFEATARIIDVTPGKALQEGVARRRAGHSPWHRLELENPDTFAGMYPF